MPRLAGVDIPDNKPLRVALTYIHGIGRYQAEQIVTQGDVDGHKRSGQLSEDELARIAGIVDNQHVVEGALRQQVAQNIGRLRDIHSYRGDRHRRNLPVRGQSTQTNARTRKGKRKTVAGKKSVKGKKG